MPIAMTPEQQALQASLRDWAKRADPIAAIRARADPAAVVPDLTQILLTQVAERVLGLPR